MSSIEVLKKTNNHVDLFSKKNQFLVKFNCSKMKKSKDFFVESQEILKLPDYFGHNWDAFDECVTDLDWLIEDEISSIVFVFLESDKLLISEKKEEKAILFNILEKAILYWDSKNINLRIIMSF